MNINRNNYEEFFILFLDNELSADQRQAVQLFAEQNPDLGVELDLLKQTRFSPDDVSGFGDHSSLLKSESSAINESNYEEWMLSAIDEELKPHHQIELDHFLIAHPEYKAQLHGLMKAKLQPENLHYYDKSSLYRHEPVRSGAIIFQWRKYAAAAALLLTLGLGSLYVIRTDKEDEETPAVAVVDSQKSTADQPNKPVIKEIETVKEKVADYSVAHKISKSGSTDNNASTPIQTILEKSVDQSPINEAPEKTVESPIETTTLPALTNSNTNSIAANVTSDNPSSFTTTEETIDNDPLPSEPGGQKKLRGIFRKITRTFEKNTNIKATDDEDRLLLGGLAIRL